MEGPHQIPRAPKTPRVKAHELPKLRGLQTRSSVPMNQEQQDPQGMSGWVTNRFGGSVDLVGLVQIPRDQKLWLGIWGDLSALRWSQMVERELQVTPPKGRRRPLLSSRGKSGRWGKRFPRRNPGLDPARPAGCRQASHQPKPPDLSVQGGRAARQATRPGSREPGLGRRLCA